MRRYDWWWDHVEDGRERLLETEFGGRAKVKTR